MNETPLQRWTELLGKRLTHGVLRPLGDDDDLCFVEVGLEFGEPPVQKLVGWRQFEDNDQIGFELTIDDTDTWISSDGDLLAKDSPFVSPAIGGVLTAVDLYGDGNRVCAAVLCFDNDYSFVIAVGESVLDERNRCYRIDTFWMDETLVCSVAQFEAGLKSHGDIRRLVSLSIVRRYRSSASGRSADTDAPED